MILNTKKRSYITENDVYGNIVSMLMATDARNALTNSSYKMGENIPAALAAGFWRTVMELRVLTICVHMALCILYQSFNTLTNSQ